jgi:hypothetical protein
MPLGEIPRTKLQITNLHQYPLKHKRAYQLKTHQPINERTRPEALEGRLGKFQIQNYKLVSAKTGMHLSTKNPSTYQRNVEA